MDDEYGPSDAVEYEPSVGSHGSGSGRMGGADLGYPATSHGGSFAGAGAMSGGSGLNTLTSLAQGPTPYLPASSQLSLGVPDDDSYAGRLAKKVRSQAQELMEMRKSLRHQQDYSALCERRILELMPEHPIPVTRESLGTPGPVAAAPRSQRERRDADGGRDKSRLERQYSVSQKRLRDALAQVKTLRGQVEAQEKELTLSVQRSKSLHTRVGELEAKLRHSGHTHLDHKKRKQAQAATNAKIEALQAELDTTRHKLDVTADALAKESKEGEKQRAYIAVLERTVKVRAEEVGLQGQGQMLTELARLRGELSACAKDLEAREEAGQAMQAELASLRNEYDAVKEANERLRAGQLDLEELATGAVPEGDLKASVMKLQAQKTALLDYVQETADAKSALQAQVEEQARRITSLEQELTQAQQQRDSSRRELEETSHSLSELRDQLSQERSARQAAEARAQDKQDAANDAVELRAVQEQLLDNIRELNTRASNAEAALAEFRNRATAAESAADAMRQKTDNASSEAGTLQRLLADAQATITARDALVKELEAERSQLVSELTELRHQTDSKAAQAAQADQRAASSAASMAAIQAANNDLEQSLASITAELDSLRSLQTHVQRLETHMAAVCSAEEDRAQEARDRAAAMSMHDGDGEAGEGGASAADGPVERGRTVVSQAERSLHWAAGPEMSTALPETSAAVRRLCAWLRTAGVELGDAGKRLSVEGRERVSQRRMLHDEIHALRQERDSLQGRVDELEDELLQTKNSSTATLKRREAELEEARKQLAEVTERAESAAELATSFESANTEARAQASELRQKLLAAQAAISASTDQSERTLGRLSDVGQQLQQVTEERDELREAKEALEEQVEASNKAAAELRLEKRVIMEKLTSVEMSHSTASEQVAELSTNKEQLEAQCRELASQLADVRQEQEALRMAHDELEQRASTDASEWQTRHDESQRELEKAALLAEQQHELATDLEAANREMTEEKAVIQRSMIGMTVEMDAARKALDRALQAAEGAAGADDQPARGGVSQQLQATVERAASFISHHGANVDGLSSRVEHLTAENADLRARLASAQPQLAALVEAGTSARERAEAMVAGRSTIAQLRGELASAESRMQVMRAEADDLRAQLVDAQTECERAAGRIAELVTQVESVRVDGSSAQGRVQALEATVQELRERLRVEGRRAATATSASARLKAQGGQEHERLGSALSEAAQLRQSNAQQADLIDELKSLLDATRAAEAHASSEAATLSQRLATVTAQLAAKDAEAADWQRRCSQTTQHSTALQRGVAADLGALTAENEDLVRRHSDSMARLAVAEAELEQLRSEVAHLRADLRRSTTELSAAHERVEQLMEERDRLTQEKEQLHDQVRQLRDAADGAVSAQVAEEGQLAKVIKSKENLERELLQALKENEQLRQARHNDMRTALAEATQATTGYAIDNRAAVVPAQTVPPAPAQPQRPAGSGAVLTAADDGTGREYVVTGSPGTTVRVSRAGSIRINLPAGHPDAVRTRAAPAARHQHTRFAAVPEHEAASGAGLAQASATRARYTSTTTRTSAVATRTSATSATATSSRLQHPERPRGTAPRGGGSGDGTTSSTSQLAPFGSAPTSGAARLQERLRNMHAAFAELRKSAVR